MKRRSFLQLLGLSPAVAAIPAVAQPAAPPLPKVELFTTNPRDDDFCVICSISCGTRTLCEWGRRL